MHETIKMKCLEEPEIFIDEEGDAVGDILSGYPHSSSLTRVAHFGLDLCFTGGPNREKRRSPIRLQEGLEELPT